jgi:hypothetical membrane protein
MLFIAACLNSVCLQANTIAFQNEKTGIIQTVDFIGVVYGFAADIFIFHLSFGGLEVVGVCVVMIFTVTMMVRRLMKD